MQIVHGACGPESHIAEGPIASDLTKRQSRFFCDTAVISFHGENSSHVMVQFVQGQANHGQPIGFAGIMNAEGNTLEVDHVYLETGRPTPVVNGVCRFFFQRPHITGVMCGARIEEGARATVPIVAFNASPGQ